jgi:nitroreductase
MIVGEETSLSPFFRLVSKRRSIRRFLDKPVERGTIIQCLEAARLAPSAENRQPWRFVIIDDPQLKLAFVKQVFSGIYSVSKFAAHAPVLIVILAQLNIITHRIGKQIQNVHFHLLDIGITGEHLVLQAEELGLGTCWIGWFNTKKVRKVLKVPKKYQIISILALGHSASSPPRERKRKTLDEIAWFNEIKE